MGSLAALPAPKVRDRGVILAVLCLSLLIVSLDNTVLNVAIPDIVRELNATSGQLQWVIDAYAVVFAGLLLVIGSIGDRVGRKWTYLCGLTVFGAGSAISAFAGSPDHLIAARVVMGVGAAAIMPSTLSILTNVFPEPAARARAIGLWSGTTGLGVAVGPVIGGWLLAHYWWGSVFLINVPIAALAVVATLLIVPNSANGNARRSDPLGAALSIIGVGALLWGIIEAPTRGWDDPVVLGALLGAVVVLGIFARFEQRSSSPMLRVAFFASRRFSVAMAGLAFVIFSLMGGLFVLTQYLQFALGYSALQAGMRISPIAAVILVVAPGSMFAVQRIGTKPVVAAGIALIAGGLFALSRVTVAGGYGDALPAFFCLGIGAGLSFAPCTDAVMGSLPREDAGVGSATNSAALQTGGAMGVAVFGSLLNTRYQDQLKPLLAHHPMPASVLHLIMGSLGGALEVAKHAGPLGAALTVAAQRAFVHGLDLAVLVGGIVALVAVGLVVALLPNRPERTSLDHSTKGSAEDAA